MDKYIILGGVLTLTACVSREEVVEGATAVGTAAAEGFSSGGGLTGALTAAGLAAAGWGYTLVRARLRETALGRVINTAENMGGVKHKDLLEELSPGDRKVAEACNA